MLSHGQTVHFRPHSVIHNQKAEHQSIPKIRLKVNFRDPMKRQIFGDTSGQDPNLHLALCLKVKYVLGRKEGSLMLGLCATLLAPSSIDAWRATWGVSI